MYAKPLTTGGTMPLSSFGWTFLTPIIRWVEGLVKSKSKSPTLQPRRASVNASVVATRLLPTPPFPLETAMILPIRLNRSFMTLVRGSIWLSYSFYVFKPDSASFGDFKVWTAAFRALDVGVCHFRNEVYRFGCSFVQFLLFEKPSVPADSALKRCLRLCDVELCVFEVGWLELRKREAEDILFYLLQFANFDDNFLNFFQLFFFSDLL